MSSFNAVIWLSGALFLGILACLEIGYHKGRRTHATDPDAAKAGIGAIEAAVFGLLGLIIAFSYGAAATRLEARRQLIAQEANAIGTAYLRLDLLPETEQPALRDLFRRYLEARLRVYERLSDPRVTALALDEAGRFQTEIWKKARSATRLGREADALLVLPALNEMIDVTTLRTQALETRTPDVIICLLFGLTLVSALLVGQEMSPRQRRPWPDMVLFAIAISFSIFVVLDLDRPRFGIIRLDAADKVLIQLRDTMK
jgi:hypothetical protein